MVCRKIIIGFYGLCDCEICFPKDPLLYKKLSEKYISEINSAIKGLENDIEDNEACKYCTSSMCKYCFDENIKDNETTAEEPENILDDTKHMKDNRHPHPGKVANDLLRLDDDNTLIDGSLVFSNILIDLDLCGSRDGERFIKRFFDGLEDVDHILAYKLAKAIEGTDVRFWMDLQEKYDEHMEKNK
jgi:hypothetical protein